MLAVRGVVELHQIATLFPRTVAAFLILLLCIADVILVCSDRVLVYRLANDGASRAKVTDSHLALIIDEEICRLDVSVHEVFRMEELGGAQNIEHHCSHV